MKTYDAMAVISIDMLNDFFEGGALPVPEADQTIEPMNQALAYSRLQRQLGHQSVEVLVRERHPEHTVHFDEWPVHGVAGTYGGEFHKSLAQGPKDVVVDKGFDETSHGYSGFEGVVHDSRQKLQEALEQFGRSIALMIGGLATDYCVLNTVLDARRLGFDTFVLEDAIRAVNIKEADGTEAIQKMRDAGAKFIKVADLIDGRVLLA